MIFYINNKVYSFGANSHKQHLFDVNVDCQDSLCGTGYSGDAGINYASKAKKCKLCIEIAKEAGYKSDRYFG